MGNSRWWKKKVCYTIPDSGATLALDTYCGRVKVADATIALPKGRMLIRCEYVRAVNAGPEQVRLTTFPKPPL